MELDSAAILDALISLGVKVLIALALFIFGRWLAGFLSRWVFRVLKQREVDEAVARMARTLTYITVLVLAAIIAIGALGIQTTALAGLVAALGLAGGLALQGALGNFAAGVLILVFRPYGIGDVVEVGGETGVVDDIQIVSTVLITADSRKVIIPNGVVAGGAITNYSATGMRRVDLVFGIGYDDDLQKAKDILTELVMADERVLADPAPAVRVLELADSSVNFAVRPFVKTEDYWDVYFDLTEQVKLRFDREGISIPFPQQDVHLISANGANGSA